MSNDIIKFKRGDEVQIPSLLQGEPYFAWDSEDLYVGGLTGNVNLLTKNNYHLFNAVNGSDITTAFQNALDNYSIIVFTKDGEYLISDTLKIPSNTKIILGLNTNFKLVTQTNKVMFENSDTIVGNVNIEIIGGTFNGNNLEQTRNDPTYIGTLLRFNNVTRFTMKNNIIKNPVSFGIQVGDLHEFLFENIKFDYTQQLANMDGLHLNGLCDDGTIRNLYGDTFDDFVALNADDGSQYELTKGEIKNITIDGLFNENGYRAVRILSAVSPVHDISINNIKGNFTFAAVLFSHFTFPETGTIYNISIDNVKATSELEGVIHITANVLSLNINNVMREENTNSSDLIRVFPNYIVSELNLSNIIDRDGTANGTNTIKTDGRIANLLIDNLKHIRTVINSKGSVLNITPTGIVNTLMITNSNNLYINNLISISGVLSECYLTSVRCENPNDIINIDTTLSTPFFRMLSVTYLGLVNEIVNIGISSNKVRMISFDTLIDMTKLTAGVGDIVKNGFGSGTPGLTQYNGVNWVSILDGTIIV